MPGARTAPRLPRSWPQPGAQVPRLPGLPCAPADVERERRAGHRARYRLVDAQNAPFGAASKVMGTAHHNVPNGGTVCVLPDLPHHSADAICRRNLVPAESSRYRVACLEVAVGRGGRRCGAQTGRPPLTRSRLTWRAHFCCRSVRPAFVTSGRGMRRGSCGDRCSYVLSRDSCGIFLVSFLGSEKDGERGSLLGCGQDREGPLG